MPSARKRLLLLAAFFLFVALGTFTWPGSLLALDPWPFSVGATLYIASAFVPPLLVICAALFPSVRESAGFRRLARAVIYLLSGIALLGVLPAVIFMNTPGFPVHVARMMTLFFQGLFCCQALRGFGERRPEPKRYMGVYAIPMLAVSLWSVAAGVAAASQAIIQSNGKPYCIGDTMHPGIWYGEIDSLFDLRGIDLVVSRTAGVTGTLHWYHHAILAVPGNSVSSRWNWSITHMRFEPISSERQRLLALSVRDVCTPKEDFIWCLAWPF